MNCETPIAAEMPGVLHIKCADALWHAHASAGLILAALPAPRIGDPPDMRRRNVALACAALHAAAVHEAGDPPERALAELDAAYRAARPECSTLAAQLAYARLDAQLTAALEDRDWLRTQNAALRTRIKELTLLMDERAGDACEREIACFEGKDAT